MGFFLKLYQIISWWLENSELLYDVLCVYPVSMDMPKSRVCLWQICVRHWHGWDMAAFVFAGCWENKNNFFYLFLAWLRHGCNTATSKLKNKNKVNSAGSALIVPLDLNSPSLIYCLLSSYFICFFLLFCLCFSLSLIFPDASCCSQSNPHAGRVWWVLYINIWLMASGVGSLYSGLKRSRH